jgi:hypothetical protein
MPESKDVVEVVTTPAEVPVKEAPEPVEMPVETEDSFVDDSVGTAPVAPETVTEEESPVESPEPEAPTVAPEEKKEEAPAEPEKPEVKETEPKAPEVKAEEVKISRLDRRLAEKYAENLVLKGAEIPSSEQIESELASMNLEEKKNALRNLLDENRTIRGQKPEALSQEDEEAIIEAEVDRRYQIEQQAEFEKTFQDDLVATLSAHPELDSRTKSFNPKIEKAVHQIVQSGVLASEAYAIVSEAIQTAKEDQRKANEIAAQQSMSGAVIAPPVSEPINKDPETDEEKFLQDALG